MLKRIVIEKRLFILPILIALVLNAIAYALVIYPLASSVAGGEQRAAAAATVAGKARAEQELAKFYKDVLPPDLPSAGRMMYLQLAQLARECNLRYTRRALNAEPLHESHLVTLQMTMTLEGSYEDIRRYIYRIESGAPFVVIDNVALGQGREPEGPLALTLQLSTFFRVTGNGT